MYNLHPGVSEYTYVLNVVYAVMEGESNLRRAGKCLARWYDARKTFLHFLQVQKSVELFGGDVNVTVD
jgi:hypothetical protein